MANEKRLIDANALMEAYLKEQKKPGIYSVAKIIMDAPTVDAVEVVHGRWIPHWGNTECSVCGYITYLCGANYCPNCGAKMDGDGNG